VVFGLAFMLYATIASVYRIQTVGLNPLQLVLVGTALELAVLIFEVPTNVFADTYGRRRSVIVGFFLIGAGFSFEGALPDLRDGAGRAGGRGRGHPRGHPCRVDGRHPHALSRPPALREGHQARRRRILPRKLGRPPEK
jgi:hypothetical protein